MHDSPLALITGGRSGIGLALARQLLASGHRVAVVTRDPAGLNALDGAFPIEADPTTPEGVVTAFAACAAEFGQPPQLLAHCVGNTLIAPIHRTKNEQWREIMRVNLDSAYLVLSAWLTSLQSAGLPNAAAVFASSVVARIGVANHEAIAAAKGGVEALVRSASATYAGRGWRINAVAPGMTETPMTESMLRNPAFREGASRQYPLAGVQSADQVAEVMRWLLSSESARITGQTIPVDGGFTSIRPLVK
jgi:NAD(P)-dependent dehydrogenase (short-subunit alcohol dehydrogenase family)